MAGPPLNRASFIAVCLAAFAALASVPEAVGQTSLPGWETRPPVELPEWVVGTGIAFLLMFLWTFVGLIAGALRVAYTARHPHEPDRFVGGWLWRLGLAFGLSGVIVVALDAAWPVWVSP